MAKLICADGTTRIVRPANGRKFTLQELQGYVGGYIELMPGMPFQLVLDEEGLLKEKPYNVIATMLVLAALSGKELRYTPRLVGDVLLLDDSEKMTSEE